MLEYLRGKVSDRKLRLFAVACCRRIWHLLTDERSRQAVVVAERIAEGVAGREEFLSSSSSAREALMDWPAGGANRTAARVPPIVLRGIGNGGDHRVAKVAHWAASALQKAGRDEEPRSQCGLIRDIFTLLFRPVTIPPAWLSWHGGLLVSMAHKMYESRDFSDMPVLADALEEAGCQDADILGHCRSGGEHVRGCWVIDLLLGKS
jgi:hypothetical protein